MDKFTLTWSGIAILSLTFIAAYITHLYWLVTTLFGSGEMMIRDGVLAILGLIVPPVGVIHGITLWF